MSAATSQRKIAVLGASGSVGSRVVRLLLDRGFRVAAQTRDAERLAVVADKAQVHVFNPLDSAAYGSFLAGAEAVVFALGSDLRGPTTLFSQTTRLLLEAMQRSGVERLIAITGVGAGETRGHGGLLYDRVIFPLFTRHLYVDKDRQEGLIEESDTRWTILRPAPFVKRRPQSPLNALTIIRPGTKLTAVTREEVAEFIVQAIERTNHVREKVFLGHGIAG